LKKEGVSNVLKELECIKYYWLIKSEKVWISCILDARKKWRD